MPKFVIERTVPGAGKMSAKELQAVAQKSNGVVRNLPDYHWVQTYVGGDRMYCVHIAPSIEAVREHAKRGGFPVDRITEVAETIDPTTAE